MNASGFKRSPTCDHCVPCTPVDALEATGKSARDGAGNKVSTPASRGYASFKCRTLFRLCAYYRVIMNAFEGRPQVPYTLLQVYSRSSREVSATLDLAGSGGTCRRTYAHMHVCIQIHDR
jgi:hypothetical protein